MTHTYEFDEAMLGSEWTERDDMYVFAGYLEEAFAARGIDCVAAVCISSNNGGRGLICPDDGDGCEPISALEIDRAWQDALAAYVTPA